MTNLIAYCRNYASTYLNEHEIQLSFITEEWEEEIIMNGERRRNVFLILKEALHNVVKHADADKVEILFKNKNGMLSLEISDNGKGIPGAVQKGNGLDNMRKRAEILGGALEINNEKGTNVILTVPILNKDEKNLIKE